MGEEGSQDLSIVSMDRVLEKLMQDPTTRFYRRGERAIPIWRNNLNSTLPLILI
jgi:hypothetical protein